MLEATVQVRNYTNKQIKIKTIKLIKSQKKYQKGHNFCYFYLKFRILKTHQTFLEIWLAGFFLPLNIKSTMFWNPMLSMKIWKLVSISAWKISIWKFMKIRTSNNNRFVEQKTIKFLNACTSVIAFYSCNSSMYDTSIWFNILFKTLSYMLS